MVKIKNQSKYYIYQDVFFFFFDFFSSVAVVFSSYANNNWIESETRRSMRPMYRDSWEENEYRKKRVEEMIHRDRVRASECMNRAAHEIFHSLQFMKNESSYMVFPKQCIYVIVFYFAKKK